MFVYVSLQDIQQVKTPEELENFMLKHGENIIDTLGAEVDRLEKELKVLKYKFICYSSLLFASCCYRVDQEKVIKSGNDFWKDFFLHHETLLVPKEVMALDQRRITSIVMFNTFFVKLGLICSSLKYIFVT